MDEYGYALGQTITIQATYASSPTGVALTLVDPTGVVTTVDPLAPISAGLYRHQFIGSKPGLWTWRFVGAGGSDPGVVEGTSLVRESPAVTVPVGPRYTYDLATAIGKVRLAIDDRDFSAVDPATAPGNRSAIFTDAELPSFVDLEAGSPLRAAADACEAIAANKNLLLVTRKVGDQSSTFGDARDHYMKLAAALRTRAERVEGWDRPAFGAAEIAWDDATYRSILENDDARDPGRGW